MNRLFIAIPLPISIEEHLLRLARSLVGKDVRPVKTAHLTLKFLGLVKEDVIEDIKQRLSKVVIKPFNLSLGSVGFFPNEKSTRVVWVGVTPHEQVLALQQQVDGALEEMFPREERFMPHLTLARIADDCESDTVTEQAKKLRVEPKTFLVEKIVLYQSTLRRDGPVYEEMMVVRAADKGKPI